MGGIVGGNRAIESVWALLFFAEVDSLRADTEVDIVGSSVKGKDGKTHVIYIYVIYYI